MDQVLASFDVNAEFPYNCARDLLNKVIGDINHAGPVWFMETKTQLDYNYGPAFNLMEYGVDPRRILYLRRTANGAPSRLMQLHSENFERQYRGQNQPLGIPAYWAKFNATLELNCIPDKDYALELTHYKPIPLVVNATDELPIPDTHKDVLVDGVEAYLLQKIGRQDTGDAFAVFKDRMSGMLVQLKADSGLPSSMPRCW